MKQSESVKTLLEALAKTQSKFSTLPKDKKGYGYKYTDIDTVISYVRPLLSENGLGFMQSLSTVDEKPAITTRVFHISGEWIEDTTILPDVAMAKTNAAQNMGASITYMRRYFLCAMLGITSDEDTDAVVENRNESEARSKASGSDTPKSDAPKIQRPNYSAEQIEKMKKWTDGTFTEDELAEFRKRCCGADYADAIEDINGEYEKRKAIF